MIVTTYLPTIRSTRSRGVGEAKLVDNNHQSIAYIKVIFCVSAKNTLGGVAIINAILVCEQKNRGNLFYLSRGDAYMLRSVCCSIYPTTQAQMNYQPRIE